MQNMALVISKSSTATTTRPVSSVHYYATRRAGPESRIEDAVIHSAPMLFYVPRRLTCIFGSRRIGNGLPDLTIVRCTASVRTLPDLTTRQALILGYIRVARRVSAATLADRLQLHKSAVEESLEPLVHDSLVRGDPRAYTLRPKWRDVVEQIVAVEAKHLNWKRAVSQAVRNTVFANLSYIALPEKQAILAHEDPIRRKLGIGVIAISAAGQARLFVRARKQTPLLWRCYFDLAADAARNLKRA